MSIICTLALSDCIYMAADSIRVQYEDGIPQFLDTEGFKVYSLSKVHAGISYCGDMTIKKMPVENILEVFENTLINEEDSVESIFDKLSIFFKTNNSEGGGIDFHVAGYSDKNAFLFSEKSGNQERKIVTHEPTLRWLGQTEMLNKLFNDVPQLNVNLEKFQEKEGLQFIKFLMNYVTEIERFRDETGLCCKPIDILKITDNKNVWIQHKYKLNG